MNVALISKWHVHAVDYAREAQENESISIKQVWDEDTLRGKQWAQELGVSFEADLEAVLSNPEIDGIIVTTPTNLHKEVIIAAANHGKHIFTEKVLAFSVEDCEEIFSAVEKNATCCATPSSAIEKSSFVKFSWVGALKSLVTIRTLRFTIFVSTLTGSLSSVEIPNPEISLVFPFIANALGSGTLRSGIA